MSCQVSIDPSNAPLLCEIADGSDRYSQPSPTPRRTARDGTAGSRRRPTGARTAESRGNSRRVSPEAAGANARRCRVARTAARTSPFRESATSRRGGRRCRGRARYPVAAAGRGRRPGRRRGPRRRLRRGPIHPNLLDAHPGGARVRPMGAVPAATNRADRGSRHGMAGRGAAPAPVGASRRTRRRSGRARRCRRPPHGSGRGTDPVAKLPPARGIPLPVMSPRAPPPSSSSMPVNATQIPGSGRSAMAMSASPRIRWAHDAVALASVPTMTPDRAALPATGAGSVPAASRIDTAEGSTGSRSRRRKSSPGPR